jgi:hypothetical protein
MFARADTDGSGGLSQEEMSAAREAMRARAGERGGREARQGRGGPSRMMAMLCRADTNGDEAVTREEFDAAIETRFNSADKDGSGTISSAERKAAREAMREQRSGP